MIKERKERRPEKIEILEREAKKEISKMVKKNYIRNIISKNIGRKKERVKE